MASIGLPIALGFDTKTFDVEAGDVHAIGTRHALSYGGNFRRNAFDITLAPDAEDRNEGGAYVQDEIFLSDQFRWIIGGRIDKFSSIDSAVFSPRTTLMYKPAADQTLPRVVQPRVPCAVAHQQSPDVGILTPVTLPVIGQFAASRRWRVGNPDLEQETLTAFELGYSGVIAAADDGVGRGVLEQHGRLDRVHAGRVLLDGNAAAGMAAAAGIRAANSLPSRYTYLNLGTVKDKGIELGVDTAVNTFLNLFVNYSYQWMPEIEDFPAGVTINDVNWPAKNRFNVGGNVNYMNWFGNVSLNYTDEAYWQDVLDARFAGTTDAFTLVNAAIGYRWSDEKIVTSLKLTNIGNQEIQQHIFGDVLKRQVVGELRVGF